MSAEAGFKGKPMQRLRWVVALISAVSIGSVVLIYIYTEFIGVKAAPKANLAQTSVPVIAAQAVAEDVPIILQGLGTVIAFNTVATTSRVEGNITEIHFREGQYVHKGDLLIQLDKRPYQAALDQAKANLARDEAALANDQVNLARYSDLLKQNFAPEQQVANQQATVSQAEATTQSDEAVIESAQLNLSYTSLLSPIDGVTGIRHVDIGNLIQANSGINLVTITQIKPIFVLFTLPEADIDRVRQAMKGGTLSVEAYAANDERKISEGQLNLIDNTVNQTTGTFQLKAQFANEDGALWPGQFVNAHLILRTVKDGVTIPSAGVQAGPNGSFTYVINDQSQAEIRPLTVVQTRANTALIGKGLNAGEKVVIAGQFRLKPGVNVSMASEIPDASKTLSDSPIGTQALE
jgi:membrane fusion protein, multidrug efflux system